ncbi:MAG: DsbA family protein [Bdellovibrionota bacterium]
MSAQPDLIVPVSLQDHQRGDSAAAVTLVEYGDFQCPYCGAAYPVIKKLQQTLGKNLRFVFRNFPLSELHENAQLAAESAEAAASQGKFWEMHDALYQQQDALAVDDILAIADRLRLNTDLFSRELMSHKFLGRVSDDFDGGVRSGVEGTPGFFINGRKFTSQWNYSSLLQALRKAASVQKAA